MKILIFCTLFISLCLTGCNNFQKESPVCRELKHRLMTTGNTGNPVQAQQEETEVNRLARDYQQEDCS